MRVVFLGTGGSWPSKCRNLPGIAIKMNGEVILFDCGEGSQMQLMRTSLSFMKIKKIFITHFHADHFLGIPGLIQTMYLNDRKDKIEIYGPKGLKKIISSLLCVGYFTPTFDVEINEISNNEIIGKNYVVRAIEVEHNIPTLAYSIEENERPGKFNLEKAKKLGIPEGPLYRKLQRGEEIVIGKKVIKPQMVMGKQRKGRKIVYSGDTKPTSKLIEFGMGADVLIHDATTDSKFEAKANDYGHSSSRQAAEIAKKCNASFLFLFHISPRYKDATSIENEAKEIFKNSKVAEDLMEFDVELRD